MKKRAMMMAAMMGIAACGWSQRVNSETAQAAAIGFWAQHHPDNVAATATPKELVLDGLDGLHVFDMEGQGFVIVAADERVRPVLAYSFDSRFPAEPGPELAYWLRGYNGQMEELAESHEPQGAAVARQWQQLLLGTATKSGADSVPRSLVVVPALVPVQWDQSVPYNNLCPFDSTRRSRTVVGCVATAMAQIMRYWKYPSFGQGERTYVPMTYSDGQVRPSSVGTLAADFGHTTYLWQYMPRQIDQLSPAHQIGAIATLSYHCGVAVEMMYGVSSTGGSAAYTDCGYWATACAVSALIEHFKYDSSLHFASRSSYADSVWTAMIDAELSAGHPLYYDGSDHSGGHAFVLDGSDEEGRYHFNWGWSGYGDGFYTIDNLAPGSNYGAGGNATYTFNQGQGAIFGIRPAHEEVFDTVELRDSTCTMSGAYVFHEYSLAPRDMDTLLRHMDKVYNLHLRLINSKRINFYSGENGAAPKVVHYCPAEGVVMPDCESRGPEGCMFVGWSRSTSGDSAIYQPGERVMMKVSCSMTALWVDTTTLAAASAEEEALAVYPNPTRGRLTASLPMGWQSLWLIDATGRVVTALNATGTGEQTVEFGLEGMPSGGYTLVVRTNKGFHKRRIIKN